MTPAALSLARRVRELLSCQAAWTKSANARRFDWSECRSTDPDAVCWDLHGAMNRLAPGKENYALRRELTGRLDSANNYRGFATWQEHPMTLHADVLALLDRVIEDGER